MLSTYINVLSLYFMLVIIVYVCPHKMHDKSCLLFTTVKSLRMAK